ncbi:hypothetical protein CP533_0019 [Ophiocordyceps camponoti-saundersi (nom. inval.)]|nr:hypothetical protein CP533_0019 [Ophiocordyceps camponoti-saundersi (nom. inval.)]
MDNLPVSNKTPGDALSSENTVLTSAASITQASIDFAPLRSVCAHLNAFHAYADDGSRSVETNHYCGHVNDDVRQCLLYDSAERNARLIGIEYMITRRIYETLPREERRLWHSHVYEVKSGMLVMPNDNVPTKAWELAETREMRQIVTLYGKAYHLWQTDRGDALPLGEPKLMTSFIADGQLDWGEVERRDERLGTDYRVKREMRRDIEEPEIDAEEEVEEEEEEEDEDKVEEDEDEDEENKGNGDFAANVWNEVPVPVYAMVLMSFGGTLAFVMSIKLRSALRSVSFRELYNEIINRLAMDILMGAGALLIATGTFMAMGGGNEHVWYASNILSGYLGNTPLALFAIVNSSWALYLAYTAQRHVSATKRSPAAALVKRRSRNVQVFCLINGTAAVVGGVGSMLTATRWWAYVLLAPVVVSSIFCNFWWRRRVGYTRTRTRLLSADDIVSDLEFAAWADVILRQSASSRPLSRLMADPGSLPEVLRWLRRHHLLSDVCVAAANHPQLRPALTTSATTELDLGLPELLALPPALHPQLLDVADECVGRLGALHFRHRERFLAELLGSYCCIGGRAPDVEEAEK